MDINLLLQKISKVSIYIVAGLMPLWFLPITQDVLDFQKQALLVVLVFIVLITWLGKTVRDNEFSLKWHWVYVPVLLFVAACLVSSLLSIWLYASFWGWPLNVADSFISVLFFALFFFLVVNLLQDEKEFFWLLFTFLSTFTLATLYAILQSYKVFAIPFPFYQVPTFNTLGSMNSVAVMSAVLFPFTLIMAFAWSKIVRWILFVMSFILFLAVLLVNFFYAWFVLAVGLIVLVAFGIWNLHQKNTIRWIYFPIAIAVIAIFFLVFKFSLPGLPNILKEQSPAGNTEIAILKGSFSENAVFGTGPSTFSLNYSKYHDSSLNKNVFWGATFSSGASEIMDTFITMGVFGGGVLVIMLLLALLFLITNISKVKSSGAAWMLRLGLLASFVGYISAEMFYYSNFTSSFLGWLLLAGLAIVSFKKIKKVSLAPKSSLAVAWFSFFLVVLVFGVGFLFVASEKYMAEVGYVNGLKKLSQGNQQEGLAEIVAATQLNPSLDLYWRDLAQFYISLVAQINSDAKLKDDEKKTKSQTAVANAVFAADKAVAVAPANVENWNVRGYTYRNLIGIKNADALAIESYTKGIALRPNSPFGWTELARVYFLKAQFLANQNTDSAGQTESLKKSLDILNKAIEIDPGYAPAYYLVALVYDQQGRSGEAIKKLEETLSIAQNDVSLLFQIGMIYYQKGQTDRARIQFEKIRDLDPNYSNARYMLGLLYEKQGNNVKAIKEFEKLVELNPNNQQVKTILDNLRAGRPSFASPQPILDNPLGVDNGINP